MYYVFRAQPGTGLVAIRAKRGSKNESSVNSVIEDSLVTTAQMLPKIAYGKCQQHNKGFKLHPLQRLLR
jgi:hypothetical protein